MAHAVKEIHEDKHKYIPPNKENGKIGY